MDGRTDGHGETSIPPYNFVAADIKKIKDVKVKINTMYQTRKVSSHAFVSLGLPLLPLSTILVLGSE
jgi:hypothetical protein